MATGSSPVAAGAVPAGVTFEGAPGYARDQKSELFLLAVTNMVGESTFYEAAGDRDSRYAALVRAVAVADPQWLAGFLGWLRTDANLRSASLVGGLEAAKAMVAAGVPGGRQIVASVLRRADEPGEALAYWTSRYGRAIPKPVKRGVADAVARLYTEHGLLKYDTASKGFRFADVIDLVHPTPAAPWQGDLFLTALERRHNRDEVVRASLPMVAANAALRRAAADDPGVLLAADRLRAAGMTWEDALSLAGDRLDKAALWTALIPGMGFMSLSRNLRNFDRAGVSDEVAASVAARIADPGQVATSRQLPMRFLSAYRAAPSLRWAYPLEQAIGHALASVPRLAGRTLVLVDTSGSMHSTFSKDGTLLRWDAAVVFGVALAQRCAYADVVSFSTGSRVFPLRPGESLLRSIERWKTDGFFMGYGTATAEALRAHFAGHDRVVVVTDEQASAGGVVDTAVPPTVPMYTWNLAGYRFGHAPSGTANRHTFGGLTDQAFRMIPLLEGGRDADWPWAVG
ncbi:TROVE domain-containing protein [Asanoa iriomotensis]|uniref:TROVE domain-containing protein n=1 Tax=Asanoa iriomotensis TaxID=234613 RepID=UPI001EF3B85D|nr:TROVE domain-containing protein [Asanoa iriomotensis]